MDFTAFYNCLSLRNNGDNIKIMNIEFIHAHAIDHHQTDITCIRSEVL
jgi:hypothetical protein